MRRKLVWAVIAFLAVCLLVVLAPIVSNYDYIWHTYKLTKDMPGLSITPTPLADQSVATGMGAKLSYIGLEFEVPWDDLDSSAPVVKHDPDRELDSVELQWRSGRMMTLSVHTHGPALTGPEYDELEREILETTPRQVFSLAARGNLGNKYSLLQRKADTAGSYLRSDSQIHPVRTTYDRGFEFVSTKPDEIRVELFLPNHYVKIFLRSKNGSSSRVTQSEVNRILRTLRWVGSKDEETESERSEHAQQLADNICSSGWFASQRKQAEVKDRTFQLISGGLFQQQGTSYLLAASHPAGRDGNMSFMVFAAADQSLDFRLLYSEEIETMQSSLDFSSHEDECEIETGGAFFHVTVVDLAGNGTRQIVVESNDIGTCKDCLSQVRVYEVEKDKVAKVVSEYWSDIEFGKGQGLWVRMYQTDAGQIVPVDKTFFGAKLPKQ